MMGLKLRLEVLEFQVGKLESQARELEFWAGVPGRFDQGSDHDVRFRGIGGMFNIPSPPFSRLYIRP